MKKVASHDAGHDCWHPIVHRRFSEELFFFLISTKPFTPTTISADVRELMREFGVHKYCQYQILGEFDAITRVWLPAGYGQNFIDRATETITNLKVILPFQVAVVNDECRYIKAPSPDSREAVYSITPNTVEDVQAGRGLEAHQELVHKGLLGRITVLNPLSHPNRIKAFIAVSQPSIAQLDKREQIAKDLIKRLEAKSTSFKDACVYKGLGFAWLLVEVSCDRFYDIGRFINEIATQYVGDGIFTSTFLVATQDCIEGDCISAKALDSKTGDESVKLFLPDLYSSAKISPGSKYEIESFIKSRIVVKTLAERDKLALQGFLLGVIRGEPIVAFTALFPYIVETEQRLRDRLKNCLKTRERMNDLIQRLDPKREFIKSFETLPLSYVLMGCREVLREVDSQIEGFRESTFNDIARTRNLVMHAGSFDIHNDWRPFCESMLDLMFFKGVFEQAFDSIETGS